MFGDKTCSMLGWGASTTGSVSSSGAQQTPRTTWWTRTREVPGAFSWEWGDKKYSNWHLQTGESTSHTIYWQGAIDSLACPDIGNWQNQIAHFLLCSWKSAIVKQAVFIFKTDPQENTLHFWDHFFMAKAWIEKKERTWFSIFSQVTKAALSMKMQGHFWHQFLTQLFMFFHMLASILFSMAVPITANFKDSDWLCKNFDQ